MTRSLERFHCCASCKHFLVKRESHGPVWKCNRLGYETRPDYRFRCWDPKPRVKKALEKEQRRHNTSRRR